MSIDTFTDDFDQEATPWPAFVDLLTATTLLFTTLVAVFIFVANRAIEEGNAERTERAALREALERAGSSSTYGRLYNVEDDGQFIRITLQEAATFPTRLWTWSALKPQGKTALLQIAGILQRDSMRALYRQIRILGHTDQVPYGSGRDFTNWELSAARAAVVARYLVSEGGVDPCSISASGLGAHFPASIRSEASSHKSWDDRMTMNRRIEIEIIPAKSRSSHEGAQCLAEGDGVSSKPSAATPVAVDSSLSESADTAVQSAPATPATP